MAIKFLTDIDLIGDIIVSNDVTANSFQGDWLTYNNSDAINWNTAFSWGDHDGLYPLLTTKNQPSGFAGLDEAGKIPTSLLPDLAITQTFVATNEANMLSLTAQTGDVAVRTDVNETYILAGSDPTVLADWQKMLTPTDAVNTVNGLAGNVQLDLSFNSGDLSLTGSSSVIDLDARYTLLGHTHVLGDLPSNIALQDGDNTFTGEINFEDTVSFTTDLYLSNTADINNAKNIYAQNFFGGGSNINNINASKITSGTLLDARLSNNVALKNVNNTFTQTNIFNQDVRFNDSISVTNGYGYIIAEDSLFQLAYTDNNDGFDIVFKSSGFAYTPYGQAQTDFIFNNTASRDINVPDNDGTLALLSDINNVSNLPSNIALKDQNNNFSVGQTINGSLQAEFLTVSGVNQMTVSSDATGILFDLNSTVRGFRFENNNGTFYEIDANGNHDFKGGTATFGGAIVLNSNQIFRDNRNNQFFTQDPTTVTSNRTLTFGNGTYSNYTFLNGQINGNGSGLTDLNATNILSGTLDDTRLSSNVVLESTLSSDFYKGSTGTDWNSIAYNNGIYRLTGTTNNPNGTRHGTLLSIGQGTGGSYGFQLASNTTPSIANLKFRAFSTTQDTDWKEIYHSGNSNLSSVDWTVKDLTVANTATFGSNVVAGSFIKTPEYNLEGDVSTTSNIDLDLVTGFGFYNKLQSTTAPNRPQDYSYIENIKYNNDNILQYAHPYRAGDEKIRYRTRYSGTWTGWETVATEEWALNTFSELTGDNVAFTNVNNNFSVGQIFNNGIDVRGTSLIARSNIQINNGRLYQIDGNTSGFKISDLSGGFEVFEIDTNGNHDFKNGTATFGGNVGIGTTSPLYPFSLESATSGLISRIYNTNADGQGLLIRAGATSSATRVLQVASSNDTKIMTVNSNGNVGIGTTDPQAKLQIDTPEANGAGQGLRINRPSAGTHYHSVEFATNGTVDWSIGQNSNDAFEVYENGLGAYTRFTIKEGGNVGIGTTSPASKLTVNGDARLANSGKLYLWNDHNANYLDYRTWIASSSAGMTIRNTGADGDILLLPNGNVGIGTGSPAAKLDVNGNIDVTGASTFGGNVVIGDALTNYTNYNTLTVGSNSASEIGLIKLRSSYNSGNGAEIYQNTSGTLFFNGNSSNQLMTLDTDGDLYVYGTGYFNGYISANTDTTGGDVGVYFRENGVIKWQMYKETNDNFYIRNVMNSTFPFEINSSNDSFQLRGNTNISGNLDITGTATATDFVVSNNSNGLELKAGNVTSYLTLDFSEISTTNAFFQLGRYTNTTGKLETRLYDGSNTDTYNIRFQHDDGIATFEDSVLTGDLNLSRGTNTLRIYDTVTTEDYFRFFVTGGNLFLTGRNQLPSPVDVTTLQVNVDSGQVSLFNQLNVDDISSINDVLTLTTGGVFLTLDDTSGEATFDGMLVVADGFSTVGGSSNQFLKADGTVDSNTYLTSSSLTNYVTTNTTQTISGSKTFSSILNTNDRINLTLNNALTLYAGIFIDQNGAGDSTVTYNAGASSFVMGIDNSDNDDFKIASGTSLGTGDRLTIDSSTGDATFSNDVTATNFILSSDKRLKENAHKVKNETIDVNWKTFNFKNKPEEKRYGVIAQELEETNPEFVNTDKEGFKSVKYIDLLIAKIAELEARIKELEK